MPLRQSAIRYDDWQMKKNMIKTQIAEKKALNWKRKSGLQNII
jgi:hypothetical protein